MLLPLLLLSAPLPGCPYCYATASALLLLSHRTLTPIPKGPHFLTFRDLLLLLFIDIFLHPWPDFFISNFSFFCPCNFHRWVCANGQCGCVRMNSVTVLLMPPRSASGPDRSVELRRLAVCTTKRVSSFRASSSSVNATFTIWCANNIVRTNSFVDVDATSPCSWAGSRRGTTSVSGVCYQALTHSSH